ncbi:MAG: hypothetical protein MUP98_14690 [Candidatus Aminicenantes bacterium]|nr:hypothetical protein [Candidatus Aminicenantes bacterium]
MKKLFLLSFFPVLIIVSLVQESGLRRVVDRTATLKASAWEMIGPFGGHVRGMAANPADPNEIFAVILTGQIWRTLDAARTWSFVTVLDSDLYDIAFSPSQPHLLYILANKGIFRSIDHGAHWTELPFPEGCSSTANIWVSPVDPDRIQVAGSFWSPEKGCAALLKSADGGGTWTVKTFSCSYSGSCLCIAVDPSNPEVVYAGAWFYFLTGGAPYYNFYKSADGGDSWQPILGGTAPQTIAIDPTNPARLYAGMGGGIYRSSDSGQTWSRNNGEASALKLAIDPANPDILYGGAGEAVYKSFNGGLDWTKSSGGLGGSCTSITIDSAGLLFGSTAGVFRSADGGGTWSKSDLRMSATKIPSFAVSPSAPNIIYAAADVPSGNGSLMKSTDGGVSWKKFPLNIYYQPRSGKVVVHPSDANVVWVRDRDLWRSTDGGETWLGLPARDRMDDLADVAVSSNYPSHLFVCGTNYTYQGYSPYMTFERSVDGGTSWAQYPITTAISHSSSLAFDPNDENVIYVGGEKGGTGALFVSLNGGTDWVEIDKEAFGSDPVEAVGLDPESNGRIYVGTAGGFYQSPDRGSTWTKTASFSVKGIAIASANPNEIFAAGGAGVYRSGDRGITWTDISAGLASAEIDALQFSDADQALYIGTSSGGICRRTIQLPQRIYAPLNFSGKKVLNRSLSQAEYINILGWRPNSKNDGIVFYRIYSVENGVWHPWPAQIPASEQEFRERKVSANRTYTYALLAVNVEGREGEPAYATVR